MIAVLVQARMGSSRLPGKVLKPISGWPIVGHVLLRAHSIASAQLVALLTTTNEEDTELVKAATPWVTSPLLIYRGHPTDVLNRYRMFVNWWNTTYTGTKRIQHIIRLTADNPAFDPALVDSLVALYQRGKYDYCALLDFPDGMDCEIMKADALENAFRNAKLPSEREHVSPYIWKNKQEFRVEYLRPNLPVNVSRFRWTVDEPEDYQVVKTMLEDLHIEDRHSTIMEQLGWSFTHPEVVALNEGIKRNEGYELSLKEDYANVT